MSVPPPLTLSIVMPAYNEAAHIEPCVREWHDEVVSRIPDAEIIVVDDCSSDDTWTRLEQLRPVLPALRPIRTPQNMGHGRAVRFGLEHAVGHYVFQTDSDRQHAPADFWRVWAIREEADFVFGVRRERADGVMRVLVSLVMRIVNLLLWGRWIRDANCPFKLMRRESLEILLHRIPRDAFIPMVMIAVLARHQGFRVRETFVRHFRRTAGEQSLRGVMKWASVGTRCVKELVHLRLRSFAPVARHRRAAPRGIHNGRLS